MSVRANLVKMGKLVDLQRPGIAEAFMQPTKLVNQVRATPLTNLRYTPKATPNDGTQWRIAVQRPGLAQPLITARQEQLSSKAVVRAMARPGEQAASVPAIKEMVAVANASNQPGPGIAGLLAGWLGL